MRERDANTTGTNGCPRAQTRRPANSSEPAIYLHQRIRAPTSPHVTLPAHNPKVTGSNPVPATQSKARTDRSGPSCWSPELVLIGCSGRASPQPEREGSCGAFEKFLRVDRSEVTAETMKGGDLHRIQLPDRRSGRRRGQRSHCGIGERRSDGVPEQNSKCHDGLLTFESDMFHQRKAPVGEMEDGEGEILRERREKCRRVPRNECAPQCVCKVHDLLFPDTRRGRQIDAAGNGFSFNTSNALKSCSPPKKTMETLQLSYRYETTIFEKQTVDPPRPDRLSSALRLR